MQKQNNVKGKLNFKYGVMSDPFLEGKVKNQKGTLVSQKIWYNLSHSHIINNCITLAKHLNFSSITIVIEAKKQHWKTSWVRLEQMLAWQFKTHQTNTGAVIPFTSLVLQQLTGPGQPAQETDRGVSQWSVCVLEGSLVEMHELSFLFKYVTDISWPFTHPTFTSWKKLCFSVCDG